MISDQIIIYERENGEPSIQIKLEKESLWLSQKQIATLFEKDSDTIGLHFKNIYKTGELDPKTTTEYFSVVQIEGERNVKRNIRFYNLDAIISVGYRVNSKKGTQFRIWANKIIKDHLVKGYTKNEARLNQLKKTIQLIHKTTKSLGTKEIGTQGFINILTDYTLALDILDDYDHQRVVKNVTTKNVLFHINYNEAISAIDQLRVKFNASHLFGNEKDSSFKSSIAVIDQTFNGNDLYPSIEEKAANLLYLVVKNHSFTDGNKRIAAWLFIWYLDKNQFLYKNDSTKKITNSTLVALTLMIAESSPKEKDLIINIIINLINSGNE